MRYLQQVNLDNSGKKALIKNFFRFLIFIVCLILVEQTRAQADLPYILDPSSSDVMISTLNIKGPLDFCGEPVPLDNQEVRERLEKELLVTLWNRPQIILWMKRSGRYMSFIEEILKQNNMPDDLKYLAIIESSLISHVSSSKGAKGYWQFMEETGKKYGLKVNNDIDERRNFFSSTRAAVSYLKKLYVDFGSWTLSAAAYNMGEEGLNTEILVQKENNYYNLYIPVETQQYIFRVITAKMILSNPEKFGFKLSKEDIYTPLQFELVDLMCDQDTPISIVAQAAKTYFKVIKDLNPEIRGHYLVKGRHVLLIPPGSAEGFQARYEDLLKKWLAESKEHTYVVKKGETLASMAARFNVPVQAILIWNNLGTKKHVKPGDRLFIFPSEEKSKK